MSSQPQLVLVDARSLHYYFLDKFQCHVNYISLMTKLMEAYKKVEAYAYAIVRETEDGDRSREEGFLRIFENAGFAQKVWRLGKMEKFNPIGVAIVHECHERSDRSITVITADRAIELIKAELQVTFWGPFGESIDDCRIKTAANPNRVVVSSDGTCQFS